MGSTGKTVGVIALHELPVIETDRISYLCDVSQFGCGEAEAIVAIPVPSGGGTRVGSGNRSHPYYGNIISADNTSGGARSSAVQVRGHGDRRSTPRSKGSKAVPIARNKAKV